MQGATFSISEAVWAAGDFRKKVVDSPQREKAAVRVTVRLDNVAGVKLPVFQLVKGAGADNIELETLGLAGGGRQINKAREKFSSLLDGLVRLASLQVGRVSYILSLFPVGFLHNSTYYVILFLTYGHLLNSLLFSHIPLPACSDFFHHSR